MIEYAFEDADGNQYAINGSGIGTIAKNTLRQGEDAFSWENKVIENSFLPGEKKLGTTRLMGRSVGFVLERTGTTEAEFRDELNALIRAFETCKYLVDKTNGQRMEVAPLDFSSTPSTGTEHRFTSDAFSLRMLSPWESTTESTASQALTALTFNDISINNEGFLDAYPVLTFTATVTVDDIQILIPENTGSFQIQDPLFGTVGFQSLVIDCLEGTTQLGNTDRANFVVPGTGFIQFPSGASTLRIFPSAACSVSVTWRNRFYV
jgi:hypothetical protein